MTAMSRVSEVHVGAKSIDGRARGECVLCIAPAVVSHAPHNRPAFAPVTVLLYNNDRLLPSIHFIFHNSSNEFGQSHGETINNLLAFPKLVGGKRHSLQQKIIAIGVLNVHQVARMTTGWTAT